MQDRFNFNAGRIVTLTHSRFTTDAALLCYQPVQRLGAGRTSRHVQQQAGSVCIACVVSRAAVCTSGRSESVASVTPVGVCQRDAGTPSA